MTNGSNVTQFVYRGLSDQVIEELNGSNGVMRSYAWDSMGRQLYVKIGTNVYYEITDTHGDVVALATGSALAGTDHFDVWGNQLSSSGTTLPYGFQGAAGSWTDTTTSFVSMGVRWYYPKVGRFLTADPAAGTADARTRTAGLRWIYALNSPLNYVDPTGLNPYDNCTHRACDDPNSAPKYGDYTQPCDLACLAQVQQLIAKAPAQVTSQSQGRTCDWLCKFENNMSSNFNTASRLAIQAYNDANEQVNAEDRALVRLLQSMLGSDSSDSGSSNDLVSTTRRRLRHQVEGAAYAGAVLAEQTRPAAVFVTRAAASGVTAAVNSCQHASQSLSSAFACINDSFAIAAVVVFPEAGASRVVAEVGAEAGVRIFRAVLPAEAADIAATNGYRVPAWLVGKYFYPTMQQAQRFARMMTQAGLGKDYAITSGIVPQRLLDEAEHLYPGTEGLAYFIRKELLSHIRNVTAHGPAE